MLSAKLDKQCDKQRRNTRRTDSAQKKRRKIVKQLLKVIIIIIIFTKKIRIMIRPQFLIKKKRIKLIRMNSMET